MPSSTKNLDELIGHIDQEIERLKDSLSRLDAPTAGGDPQTDRVPDSENNRPWSLEHNVTKVDGQRVDPEQRDGVLPFTADGWNADQILSNLSQVDNDSLTLTDNVRCAAVSVLAAHIQAGTSSVIKVANQTSTRMKAQSQEGRVPEEVLRNFQALESVISTMPNRIGNQQATYQDLRRLSHCMKFVVDSDARSGTDTAEYEDLTGIGGALHQEVGKSYKGWNQLKALVSVLQADEATGISLLLSVEIRHELMVSSTVHAVQLGKDQAGGVYLFDPFPRQGSQMMKWGVDDADIRDYVETSEGKGRTWKIKQLLET